MKNPTLDSEPTGDETLMSELVQQRTTALRKLYKRYHTVLHAVAMRVLHDEPDTEEVLQDVFVQLWQKPEKYCERKGKPLGWLITLARRRAIDRVRQRMAYRRATERLEQISRNRTPGVTECHTTDRTAEQTDLREYLEQAMRRLPPPQREAIECTFFNGMSQRQIAAALHLPLGTVKTRIELGLRRLSLMISGLRAKVA